ncbi:HD domain-containing protein [Methylophaga sp.]
MSQGLQFRVFDKLDIDLLYLSAPLHDIGKVGIPDSILCKPDKLPPLRV